MRRFAPSIRTCEKNFRTNLQLNVEGMLVTHPRRQADTQHESICAALLYDGRRFSATDSICATLSFAETGFTNATAVYAELVERSTGAKVTVVGVNVAAVSTVDELAPIATWLNNHRTENVMVFFQGMTSATYQSVKALAGTGHAARPVKLTIVNPARPNRVSMHTMQALQATVGW